MRPLHIGDNRDPPDDGLSSGGGPCHGVATAADPGQAILWQRGGHFAQRHRERYEFFILKRQLTRGDGNKVELK